MLTIITPTYNRAHTLLVLYESLKRQSDYSFKWLIIDDGSSDNTKDLVLSWNKSEHLFEILYLYQKNGGKHRALNYGIPYIDTSYTMIVDSDDRLTEDAVSKIMDWIAMIDKDDTFAGVSGLRGYNEQEKIGEYPLNTKTYIDALNTERRIKHLTGDKAEVYRTSLLKKYPFPEIEGENFMTESVVWNEIAYAGYKIRWFPEIIEIGNYLEDGLTQHLYQNRFHNFGGYTLEVRSELQSNDYYKWRVLGRYLIMAKIKGLGQREVCSRLGIQKREYWIGKGFSIVQSLWDKMS